MSLPVFPPLRRSDVLACQLSSWYPIFASVSIKTVTIRPLDAQFRDYLLADGVQIPQGSEDIATQSELSDDDSDEDDAGILYAFPVLDARIRTAIADFGAVFPKLNWSSPKDAAWMLPQSSPLKCTSPADVYLLLKSSDFINHDLDPTFVFEGCDGDAGENEHSYDVELSLRKWYAIDRSREFRCFVRDSVLLGASQRDSNYYDYLNDSEIHSSIIDTIHRFWREYLADKCPVSPHYIFDVLLTRDLRRAHLIDINPFAPRTDPLLFTYEELLDVAIAAPPRPKLAVIDSASHADAARNAPAFQHNMMPIEALQLSAGRTPQDFTHDLANEITRSTADLA